MAPAAARTSPTIKAMVQPFIPQRKQPAELQPLGTENQRMLNPGRLTRPAAPTRWARPMEWQRAFRRLLTGFRLGQARRRVGSHEATEPRPGLLRFQCAVRHQPGQHPPDWQQL